MTNEIKCVSVLISGRVQGVFFRSNLKIVAEYENVRGWVRNRSDGKVEALLQGKPDDLRKVLKWCETGPERAEVDSVSSKETECVKEFRNFSVIY